MSVREKIAAGEYWGLACRRSVFEEDLLRELNLLEHPKAKALLHLAWDLGHSSGLSAVAIIAGELAELLR
jgi:hypothetical protein